MNVYEKLNAARTRFHQSKLKKTGRNTFAKYDYFELGDFLIPALDIFKEVGLCAVVSFEKELATMTIVNLEKPEEKIIITSPMGSADLKACHEVQNIGAVETYQRRYLWVAALEIVEHDALDSSEGVAPSKPAAPALTAQQVSQITDMATACNDLVAQSNVAGAKDLIDQSKLTDTLKKALWAKLNPATKQALKG